MTPSDESERDVFTEYAASLPEDGTPPHIESYEEVLRRLRDALVRELQHRGMWTSPPSYFGIADNHWTGDALDELTADAYVYNFVRRLRGLRKHLKLKKNIHGLVIRNLRNLLTARQKETDPIGYCVFFRLRAAVEQTIEDGTVVRTDASATVSPGNDTVLGFPPDPSPQAPREALAPRVHRWADELLPDLITAEGHAVPKLVQRLAQRIAALKDDGVAAFRFGDLVDSLKSAVRQSWASALETDVPRGPGEGLVFVRPDPESPLERISVFDPRLVPDSSSYYRLLRCVKSSIDRLDNDRRRRELWKLWIFLRGFAKGNETVRPSNVQVGKHLGIWRARLPKLYAELGEIVRQCQGAAEEEGEATTRRKIADASHNEDPEPCENRGGGGAS